MTAQPEREMWAMSILSRSSVCPNCASAATHRSRRKGYLEQILHTVFFVSPFRCADCYERYFRVRFLTRPSAHKHHPHTA
jgi:transposase-like protein